MKHVLLAVGLTVLSTSLAQAAVIEKACKQSDRQAANSRLCGCIQDVADLTLSRGEQRVAASFFADPDKAQAVRQSDRRSDEQFWQKYVNFGSTAEAYCTF